VHWKLNESSGTNVPDSGAYGRNGTTINMEDADWVAGKLNNSLIFDGVNEYASCGDIANFERNQIFSVEFWIKTSAVAISQIIGRRLPAGSSTQGWDILAINDGTVAITLANTTLTPQNALSVRSTNTINNNAWRHVVITYAGTSLPTGVSIYIDGVKEVNNVVANSLSASIVNSAICSIGSRNAADYFFAGTVDEIVIYPYALSSGQVKNRWNGGTGREDFPFDIDSKAKIKKLGNSVTITSDARIKIIDNTKTLDSNYRIQQTAAKTLNSNYFIKKTYDKTINSNYKIKKIDNVKTINCNAWIQSGANTVTVNSNSYIEKTYSSAQISNYIIKKLGIIVTTNSDAKIKKLDNAKTIDSDAYIGLRSQATINSNYHILKGVTTFISSDYKVKQFGITKTITSDAYIRIAGIEGAIDSNYFIRKEVIQTITSNAVIKCSASKTITSDSFITQSQTATLISDYFTKKADNARTINSNYHIRVAGEIGSIVSNYNILEFGEWSEEWNVLVVIPRSVTINSNSYIKKISNTKTINSNSYIKRPAYEGAIIQNAWIKKICTKLINMNICIRRLDQTKPFICTAQYINKPIIISANSLSYTEIIETKYHPRKVISSNYTIT
jgi:hypothetical protein